MAPPLPLPLSSDYKDPDTYVESLLHFVTSSDLLKKLCGGVHILDFFTRTPDLYSTVVPEDWRLYLRDYEIQDILELLMRADLDGEADQPEPWKSCAAPPSCLLTYIEAIRRLSLGRQFQSQGSKKQTVAKDVARGMNVKKVHEVEHFSRYVQRLTADISDSGRQPITHIVDFGAGQGYLPRALASPPYKYHVVAVESRQLNIEGSRSWDIWAKLAPKPKNVVDKKVYRAERQAAIDAGTWESDRQPKPDPSIKGERGFFAHPGRPTTHNDTASPEVQISAMGEGSIQYVEHWISDGDLSRVIDQVVDAETINKNVTRVHQDHLAGTVAARGAQLQPHTKASSPNLMVISLHSCGNLVHHGIRSLLLNPAVSTVALVGCCYNLVTERLGPPTFKTPSLRTATQRLEQTTNARDPHGFPMSERLCKYPTSEGLGLRLNITARMMAVQAPQNWGKADSESFFTRHFFRALLQRIFLDIGMVEAPQPDDESIGNSSPLGWSGSAAGGGGGTTPIYIGSLKKACYRDFVSYVRGASIKLAQDPERGETFQTKFASLSDQQIADYEERYMDRKKDLSIIWSLMAFSASVIEATIVVDRWLFLMEQKEVAQAWVEPVFDYAFSPRNLVVVGIKK